MPVNFFPLKFFYQGNTSHLSRLSRFFPVNARHRKIGISSIFETKLVSSTLRTVAVKLVYSPYAFRRTNVDFFREFYNKILNARI